MKHNTKRLVRAALIAGIYVALCLVQHPLAYGPVQFRVSEALTLLPIFTPDAVWAVTVGCFLSNLFSMSPWDMLFGTLATRRLRHVRTRGLPLAAAVPPVLINAVVVGLEITYIFMPETASIPVLLFNMLTVGAGQAVCAGGLGLVLVRTVEKSPLLKQWFEE